MGRSKLAGRRKNGEFGLDMLSLRSLWGSPSEDVHAIDR